MSYQQEIVYSRLLWWAGLLHLLRNSSSPGVLWSASLPLSLRIPLERSLCDVVSWFPQCVSYPCRLLLLSRISADSCSVAFQRSTFLTLSYHLIARILLSDLFINTWILLISAFVHLYAVWPDYAW